MGVLLFLWGWVSAQAADGRGEELEICRYNAVLFAAQDYQSLPDLSSPITDATRIAAVLETQYGFEPPRIVENPTREDIVRELRDLRELQPCDALVVYYAGHGFLDKANGTGSWQPVDADPEYPSNWISNEDVASGLRALRARHVLLVSDSCFSGSFFRGGGADPSPDAAVRQLAHDKSRWVITSGGLEPVVDTFPGNDAGMSVFAYFLHRALLRADHRHVLPAELFAEVLRGVHVNASQVPQQGPLLQAGHELGYLVLVRPDQPVRAIGSTTTAASISEHSVDAHGLDDTPDPPDPIVVTERMMSLLALVGGGFAMAILGMVAYRSSRWSPSSGPTGSPLVDAARAMHEVSPTPVSRMSGDGARKPQPVEQALPVAEPQSLQLVVTLLASLFSDSELRRFVAFSYPALRHEIPSGGSLAQLAYSVVDGLQRSGDLNRAFFQKLQRERPRRHDIAQVARQFLE